jgi:hypothetical protein
MQAQTQEECIDEEWHDVMADEAIRLGAEYCDQNKPITDNPFIGTLVENAFRSSYQARANEIDILCEEYRLWEEYS